jgi:hypothetical protein
MGTASRPAARREGHPMLGGTPRGQVFHHSIGGPVDWVLSESGPSWVAGQGDFPREKVKTMKNERPPERVPVGHCDGRTRRLSSSDSRWAGS